MKKKIESVKQETQSELMKDEDTSPEKKSAAPAPVAPAPVATKWRVAKESFASMHGVSTRLPEGQILDPLGYSEQTIASLRLQGVILEPV